MRVLLYGQDNQKAESLGNVIARIDSVDLDVARNEEEFLTKLSDALSEYEYAASSSCPWTEGGIEQCIRLVASEIGLEVQSAYASLYWVILNQSSGPRVASIMAEFERSRILVLLGTPLENRYGAP